MDFIFWKGARGAFKSLYLGFFVGSFLASCFWLSWCMRAKFEMIKDPQCEQLYPGSEMALSLQIHLLAVSMSLTITGFWLSWFDELFLEDNKILESRVGLSTILRVCIQAAELCSLFNLLVALSMDRANAFNYRHQTGCRISVFKEMRKGDGQFTAFFLLLSSKAVKLVLTSSKCQSLST